MKILFVHNNFPAQFVHLAAYLGQSGEHQVVYLTEREDRQLPGVHKILFKSHRPPSVKVHPYLRELEQSVLVGQAAAHTALQLREKGFIPELIVGHSGWGATLFLKEIFPAAKLIGFFEWFYQAYGSDVEFMDGAISPANEMRIRMKNATILQDLACCDAGYCPTYWQQSQFPVEYVDKLRVIHDGIDTSGCIPKPNLPLNLPEIDLELTGVSEIITYVGRGLEPYRGFPQFMQAIELVMKQKPHAHVVVVGNQEEVFYGGKRPDGKSYKEAVLGKLQLDMKRLHFTGYLPKPLYLRVLQASTVHVYMTVRFVLSWSMLEAMSCGCTVVASATKPVTEVINDGVNGLLAGFYDSEELAKKIIYALENPRARLALSRRARKTVVERYSLNQMLQRQLRFFQEVLG